MEGSGSSKRVQSGRNREKLLNSARYLPNGKGLKGGSQEKRGRSQECKV